MKLIKSSYKIIPQEAGLEGIYKAIERAGRTCYKLEDKITDTSAKEFVDRMIKSGHNAMLEFGTIYLKCPISVYYVECGEVEETDNPLDSYLDNSYSKGIEVWNQDKSKKGYCYITTNLRVLVENNWLEDLQYICEPTEHHERRVHVKFVTDRGISHELVRHRVFSFAQESTRYCNYSRDKFDNQITFIQPSWIILDKEMAPINELCLLAGQYDRENPNLRYLASLVDANYTYISLLNKGWTPQQARDVLPNALKTEINMCGFTSDWKHFFELRDSEKAHPDMQVLAKDLHDQFVTTKYI